MEINGCSMARPINEKFADIEKKIEAIEKKLGTKVVTPIAETIK